VLKANGDWQIFSTKSIIVNIPSCSFGRMSIDNNGTKWMATYNNGLIGFNENGTVFKKITTGSDTGNLPINDARVATVDNKNQLWIGTTKGLRVLPNVNSFQTDSQLTTNPIIILEDNLAQELLYEQFITDIVVDGANNKWIGTADSGVFMVSPNGQETKYHFTTNNSPLPSNAINDIDINSATGEVFIATEKGLVSFKGTATAANEDLNSVYVYPNPVRPEFEGTVKIAGLLNKANVKITDIEGNLVYETTSEGGTIEWDTTAFGKHKVASGVYMIFISAQDGIETKVKKVMIIR
jgi:ligand-binding sensor domain-containing protein